MKIEKRQKMQKRLTKPSVITPKVVQNITNHVMDGFTIDYACGMEKVSRSAFYEHLRINPDKQVMFRLLREYPTQHALRVIQDKILKGDVKTSKWYLDRTYFNKKLTVSFKSLSD